MKLEFLESGSPDCPLIRLYEFTPKEAYQLRRIAIQLARGKETTVRLHEQPNVTAIGGCELLLLQGKEDRGVSAISSSKFKWILSPAGWLQVANLIRPFSRGAANGDQWLSETGKVKIVLSCDGRW
ncbi:MAG TPA: hypothetical protein VJA94_02105 [Candidatus Angelobacter sp.]